MGCIRMDKGKNKKTGQVNWPAFFTTMAEINFQGFFCFEREAGNQRGTDIAAGRKFVEKLLGA